MSVFGTVVDFVKDFGDDVLDAAKDEVQKRVASAEENVGKVATKVGVGLQADSQVRKLKVNKQLFISAGIGIGLVILFLTLKK